jgi:hypothetical protein
VVLVSELLSRFVAELDDLLKEGGVLDGLVLVGKDDTLAGFGV